MLTREQLLASSDDQYMNQAQLDFFRALLQQEQATIEESVALAHIDLAVQEAAADPADRASQEEVRITLLRTRERETNLLHKIEATLIRIDQGDFGFCAMTGEPIGLERLLARPTTTLSFEAQIRKENRERQYA